MEANQTVTSEVYRLGEEQCELSGWTLLPDCPTAPLPDRPTTASPSAPGSFDLSDDLSSGSYGSSCEELEEYIPLEEKGIKRFTDAGVMREKCHQRSKVKSEVTLEDYPGYFDPLVQDLDYIVTVEPVSSGTDTLIKIKYLKKAVPPEPCTTPVLSSQENIGLRKRMLGGKASAEPSPVRESSRESESPENDNPDSEHQAGKRKRKGSDKKLKDRNKKVSFSCLDVKDENGQGARAGEALTSPVSKMVQEAATRAQRCGLKRKRSDLCKSASKQGQNKEISSEGLVEPRQKLAKMSLARNTEEGSRSSLEKDECVNLPEQEAMTLCEVKALGDSVETSAIKEEDSIEKEKCVDSVNEAGNVWKKHCFHDDRNGPSKEKDKEFPNKLKSLFEPKESLKSSLSLSEPEGKVGEGKSDESKEKPLEVIPKVIKSEEEGKGPKEGQYKLAVNLANLSQESGLSLGNQTKVTAAEEQQVANAMAILLKKSLSVQVSPQLQKNSADQTNPIIFQLKFSMADDNEPKPEKRKEREESSRKLKEKGSDSAKRVRMLGGVRQEDGSWMCECGMQFKFSSGLSRHRRIKHLGIVYICDVCKKQFTRSDSLSEHMKRQHAMSEAEVTEEVQRKGWPVYTVDEINRFNTQYTEIKPVGTEKKKKSLLKKGKSASSNGSSKVSKSKELVQRKVSKVNVDKNKKSRPRAEGLVETRRLLSAKTKFQKTLTVMPRVPVGEDKKPGVLTEEGKEGR